MKTSTVLLITLAVIGVIAPLTGLYPQFLMKCVALALFAVAFNFFTGNIGLLSIGHAAFFGMGAYAAGFATKAWSFTPELALVLSLLVGVALGIVMGGMAIRRQGIYFAMITLALAQMVYFVCVQAPFTGAEDGLQRIPRRSLFGLIDLSNDLVMYTFVLVLLIAAVWGFQRIMESPFGQVLLAIRDNEPRAISLGYDVQKYKLSAFTMSAAIAGLAGGVKALTLGFAGLPDAHWTQSGNVILMCLLGGLGTPLGPVIGAILVVALESRLSGLGVVQIGPFALDLSSKVPIIIGFIFMVCVLLFRRGIVGEISAAFASAKARQSPAADAEKKSMAS
ncbi:branched-chain amino acid ABC transporter permease [Bradyrhizobium sp. G127]|jgi:branched-chain amino acid transport system permease protein|uniref:branched-chain amino acid ABC transporter permease n=1 Tax=Bradyrhizobium sp. G127 TaxID=2904800 RepID=UPI001F269D08|nr:branched-chain amino acid ABC transporter permease [Bradyrhizobium sp. G127]MCF2524605.1 branched-chain amino acid ABC transporter permease [Bradyrhizobium sp. G127]